MTQSEIIINYLNDTNDWVASYKIIKVNTNWGWLGTSADRQARELAEQGILQRKRDGKYTYYRIIKQGQLNLI